MENFSPAVRRMEKMWNTYLRVPLPWMFRIAPHKHWESQLLGDSHGPDRFVALTPSSEVLINEVALWASGTESLLLDLGCNVGRHLQALWLRGFRRLHGVDIQHAAIDLMKEKFPEMGAAAVICRGTFQDYLPTITDQYFDVTFTHGATIELVPPTYPICQEMARVTRTAVVLVINESGHYYPRCWETEFLRAGFLLTKLMRPATLGSNASLLVFIRLNGERRG